jgi:hypothetical protein
MEEGPGDDDGIADGNSDGTLVMVGCWDGAKDGSADFEGTLVGMDDG